MEATILNVPCLTLLDSAVWTITHEKGANILVGSDRKKLVEEAFSILKDRGRKRNIPEFWDGKAAERIVRMLVAGSM